MGEVLLGREYVSDMVCALEDSMNSTYLCKMHLIFNNG